MSRFCPSLCAVLFLGACLQEPVIAEEPTPKLYELRTYTTHEGKLPDLLKRFENHTVALFEKHGMTNVIYWVPVDQPNTLIYVISHKTPEAREASWKGFRNDPAWKAAFKASRENGPLVKEVRSQLLTATAFSPMK